MGKGRFLNQKLAKRTGHAQRQQKFKAEAGWSAKLYHFHKRYRGIVRARLQPCR